jgi:catechol 2,3-dioxygenase-like lactoylglutathione lyase family enzyme
MKQSIGYVSLVVRDYDEAIDFYVGTLGFALIEDTCIEAQDKRWVLVAPPGSSESRLLLARAVGEEQSSRVGNQTAGRVLLFLHTDGTCCNSTRTPHPSGADNRRGWRSASRSEPAAMRMELRPLLGSFRTLNSSNQEPPCAQL